MAKLRIIPLGGLGEVGKNMTAFEFGDDIVATPYVLPRVPAPVYGTKLTCALIRGKLAEHNIGNIQFHIVKPKDVIQAGAFSVQFIKVSHSIAGAVAMAAMVSGIMLPP